MFVQKVIWLLDDLCWVLIVVLICSKTFDFRFVDSFNARLLLSVGWNSMVYDSSLFLLYLLLLRILWLISLWFLYWLMTYCVLRVTPSVCCFCRPLMLGLIYVHWYYYYQRVLLCRIYDCMILSFDSFITISLRVIR